MKMKLVTVALSGAMLISGVAFGSDFDPKFYVGGEVQTNQYKGAREIKFKQLAAPGDVITSTDKKSLFGKSGSGASIFVGTKLTENFGFEAGLTGLSGNKIKLVTPGLQKSSFKTKSHNVYLDAMGYIPVSDCVNLIGSAGIGKLSTKMSGKHIETSTSTRGSQDVTTPVSAKSSKAGVRVGLGAEYKFDENLGARFMIRHQKGNKFVKSVNSAGLGLFYQF